MKKTCAVAVVALASQLAILSPVFAQQSSQNHPMMSMMGGGCPMMGMMGQSKMGHNMMGSDRMGTSMMQNGNMDASRMGPMTEGRLAYLKAKLKITEAQEAVWKDYADAVTDRVGIMQSVHQNMMEVMQSGNAMQRMDARIQSMETMVEAMKAVEPATSQLYTALDEEQKALADQLIGMDCGGM